MFACGRQQNNDSVCARMLPSPNSGTNNGEIRAKRFSAWELFNQIGTKFVDQMVKIDLFLIETYSPGIDLPDAICNHFERNTHEHKHTIK